MNCVLFVGDLSPLAADEVPTLAEVTNAGIEVAVFDRYFECAGFDSVLATSMMTGVYPQTHGIGAGATGPGYEGPTLPTVLQESGFDCVGIAPPAVLSPSGFGDLMCIGEGASAEALEGWLSNRGDVQRPFFVFVWGARSGAGSEVLARILQVLNRRHLLTETAVVAVETRARRSSEIRFVEPPAMQLAVISRGETGVIRRSRRTVGTVDIFPTVLALTGRSESAPQILQGMPLVAVGGSEFEPDRRVVFSEFVDERFGLSCLVACDEQSSYSLIRSDRRGGWGRASSLGLGLLTRGPGWRRRVLFELLFHGVAERSSGGGNRVHFDEIRAWGRREIKRWQADCRDRALEIRRLAGTDPDAALRTRLRGLGYLG